MNDRRPRVLITDDEQDIRWVLATLLRQEGIEPLEAESGRGALRLLRKEPVDLMLVDVRMNNGDGWEVLREARKTDADLPIILMTGYASIPSAVEAMRLGARNFLAKPFNNEDVLRSVRQALSERRLSEPFADLGRSSVMQRVREAIERVAPTDFTVIVQGETGTGKELAALALHRSSRRRNGPFVPVDCGAIPESLIESELFGHEKGAFTGADRQQIGSFEAADGGTLFLDEVANLPWAMQAKLLRALQQKTIRRVGSTTALELDVRVIVASNVDLAGLASQGRFRPDLYHRLNEFTLVLPPLRERDDDLLSLAERFREAACAELNKSLPPLSEAVRATLKQRTWPGNVRELRNAVRRAVLLADEQIEPWHLSEADASLTAVAPSRTVPRLDGQQSLRDLVREQLNATERDILERALRQSGGNKAQAARLLRIDYKTFRTKLRDYGVRFLPGDAHGNTETE